MIFMLVDIKNKIKSNIHQYTIHHIIFHTINTAIEISTETIATIPPAVLRRRIGLTG